MTNDRYRSLVYFTRDIGYSKPAQATDYLEFYWADWLRAQPGTFALAGYDLTRAGTTDPDPAKADTGYLNAVWNASTRMVAATDPVIDGKTGADLGRADAINGGKKYNKGNSTSCASRSRRTSPARSHTRSTTRRATRCRSKQPATTQQRSPGRRCRTGLLAQSTLRYPSSSLAASRCDTSAHCTTCARPST